MKILLIGLFALGSISTFAQEANVEITEVKVDCRDTSGNQIFKGRMQISANGVFSTADSAEFSIDGTPIKIKILGSYLYEDCRKNLYSSVRAHQIKILCASGSVEFFTGVTPIGRIEGCKVAGAMNSQSGSY